MARKRLGAEQIVTKLRQIEVLQGQGKSGAAACKEAGTTEQSYYCWPREYGGLSVDQDRQLKQLENENGRLRKLVANLSLEKQILKDIAQKPDEDALTRNIVYLAAACGRYGCRRITAVLNEGGVEEARPGSSASGAARG